MAQGKIALSQLREVRFYHKEIVCAMKKYGLSPLAYGLFLLAIIGKHDKVFTDKLTALFVPGDWDKEVESLITRRERILEDDLYRTGRADFQKVLVLIKCFMTAVTLVGAGEKIPEDLAKPLSAP